MPKIKVLVVDSDVKTRRLIDGCLAGQGYTLSYACSAEECLTNIKVQIPDLIILSFELPDMSCIRACQEIRSSTFVPIMLLGSRSDETNVITGLAAGADYYLVKPFKSAELLAYINAALRRELIYSGERNKTAQIRIGDLTLDISAHELKRNGDIIPLSPTEFRLIQALAQNAGCVLTRSQLLDCIWQSDSGDVYSRTVDVHIGRIRKKLGDDPDNPRYIITVASMGYKTPSE